MDKGSVGFAIGLLVLIVGAIALGTYIRELFKVEGISLDEMDGVNRPESNRPHDDFQQGYSYNCCDHCFDEHGNLVHSLNMLDAHTVPCNEEVGNYHCQGF